MSSKLGLDTRSTMDMDFLLRNTAMQRKNIEIIFKNVIDIEVEDDVSFDIVSIKDIREDDMYGGYCVNLIGKLENIRVPVNIDVATGDPITPSSVRYDYKCMFEDDKFCLSSYNFETIIAEKLQTILTRGTANSRSKDFYDIFVIRKMKIEEIDTESLANAFENTCAHRGTAFSKEDALSIISEIKKSELIRKRWISYVAKNSYASGITFDEVAKSLEAVACTAIRP